MNERIDDNGEFSQNMTEEELLARMAWFYYHDKKKPYNNIFN